MYYTKKFFCMCILFIIPLSEASTTFTMPVQSLSVPCLMNRASTQHTVAKNTSWSIQQKLVTLQSNQFKVLWVGLRKWIQTLNLPFIPAAVIQKLLLLPIMIKIFYLPIKRCITPMDTNAPTDMSMYRPFFIAFILIITLLFVMTCQTSFEIEFSFS